MIQKLRESPFLANTLLVVLGAMFVACLYASEGRPLLFFLALARYMAYLGVVLLGVAITARLGGEAVSAVSSTRKPHGSGRKSGRKHKR